MCVAFTLVVWVTDLCMRFMACFTVGVSRPSPMDTASSHYGDNTTPHSSHDKILLHWTLLCSCIFSNISNFSPYAWTVTFPLIVTLSEQYYHYNQIHKIVFCFRSFPQDTFQIQAGAKPGSKQRQVFLFPECLLIAKREREDGATLSRINLWYTQLTETENTLLQHGLLLWN